MGHLTMGCGTSHISVEKSANYFKSAFDKRKKPIIILPPPKLYEDDAFQYKNWLNENSQIVWKRPHEMVEKPELYVDGTSRRDVIQGILGKM